MNKIYTIADNIISSLGFTSKENFEKLKQGESGIKQTTKVTQDPLQTSQVDSKRLDTEFSTLGNPSEYTRLEKLMILSLNSCTNKVAIPARVNVKISFLNFSSG